MTAYAGPLPVPARITQALDVIGAEGPDVDLAVDTWEGNPAGDVDAWERGDAYPTTAQVELLAAYTGRPTAWFYLPVKDWEMEPTRFFLCDRRRRRHALTVVESRIDWEGVLQVAELTPPNPPYRPRKPKEATVPRQPTRAPGGRQKPVRGAHLPTPADGTPDTCTCGLRTDLRSRYHLTPTDLPPATPGPQDRAAGDLEDHDA